MCSLSSSLFTEVKKRKRGPNTPSARVQEKKFEVKMNKNSPSKYPFFWRPVFGKFENIYCFLKLMF